MALFALILAQGSRNPDVGKLDKSWEYLPSDMYNDVVYSLSTEVPEVFPKFVCTIRDVILKFTCMGVSDDMASLEFEHNDTDGNKICLYLCADGTFCYTDIYQYEPIEFGNDNSAQYMTVSLCDELVIVRNLFTAWAEAVNDLCLFINEQYDTVETRVQHLLTEEIKNHEEFLKCNIATMLKNESERDESERERVCLFLLQLFGILHLQKAKNHTIHEK